MEKEVYRLTVAPSTASTVEVNDGQQRERPVTFFDFLVNGRPLRDLLDVPEDWEEPLQ